MSACKDNTNTLVGFKPYWLLRNKGSEISSQDFTYDGIQHIEGISAIRYYYPGERMTLAQQFIEKTKVSYFIIKEYYDLTSWKELIQFVEKNYISPFTGNRIDGVVCQRTDKHYYCTVNDPGCFKLKRKVMITNDFLAPGIFPFTKITLFSTSTATISKF